LTHAINILLVKPFQPIINAAHSPPLGLLYLASSLREQFGSEIIVRVIDAKLRELNTEELLGDIIWADLVGLSALNYEMNASFEVARATKSIDPQKIVAMGGPCTHRRASELLNLCLEIDWVFDGESERTFPEAIRRWRHGIRFEQGIPGLYYRDAQGTTISPGGEDFIAHLDDIPLPAWDLVDFDAYAARPNMNTWMRGTRYATLFTSRGCPYKCSYCHDIFTKKFRWRSADNVLAEIKYLVDTYSIDEFQIVDDIFNLHKPRLKEIFAKIKISYPNRKFHFCFPNGLRADILDTSVIETMQQAGAYQLTVAVETVTDRLQALIEKNLSVEKVDRVIKECHQRGLLMKGYFMLGFPTETRAELWRTIRFALRSKLTFASFFVVVPQPETPLYNLAQQENAQALEEIREADYYAKIGWYQRAYGVQLNWLSRLAFILFYAHPARLWRIFRHVGFRRAHNGLSQGVQILTRRTGTSKKSFASVHKTPEHHPAKTFTRDSDAPARTYT